MYFYNTYWLHRLHRWAWYFALSDHSFYPSACICQSCTCYNGYYRSSQPCSGMRLMGRFCNVSVSCTSLLVAPYSFFPCHARSLPRLATTRVERDKQRSLLSCVLPWPSCFALASVPSCLFPTTLTLIRIPYITRRLARLRNWLLRVHPAILHPEPWLLLVQPWQVLREPTTALIIRRVVPSVLTSLLLFSPMQAPTRTK